MSTGRRAPACLSKLLALANRLMTKLHPNLRGIEALASVARCRNYKDASRELAISIPGLMQRIAKLEERLGRTLVEACSHDRRRRELTSDGALLVDALAQLQILPAANLILNHPNEHLLRELEKENTILKQLLVEAMLANSILRDARASQRQDRGRTDVTEAPTRSPRKAAAMAKAEARAFARHGRP